MDREKILEKLLELKLKKPQTQKDKLAIQRLQQKLDNNDKIQKK